MRVVSPFVETFAPNADDWEFCPVPGCEFCVCKWGGVGKCHPHSVEEVGQAEMDRRYAATREPNGSWNGKVGA